jgi:hypothetical protein
MKVLLIALTLSATAAGAQTLDFTSGPINSVQAASSAFSGFPAVGDDVYGVINLGALISVSGSSRTYDATGDFGIVPASALYSSDFVAGTGVFAPPGFAGQVTLATTNGQINAFNFSLSESDASVSADSAANSAEADSDGGGFRAFSPAGSVYTPAPPPPGYSCVTHATPWACEAQNGPPGENSIIYHFYSAPSAGAVAAPEIESSNAIAGLTMLLGLAAIASRTSRRVLRDPSAG